MEAIEGYLYDEMLLHLDSMLFNIRWEWSHVSCYKVTCYGKKYLIFLIGGNVIGIYVGQSCENHFLGKSVGSLGDHIP